MSNKQYLEVDISIPTPTYIALDHQTYPASTGHSNHWKRLDADMKMLMQNFKDVVRSWLWNYADLLKMHCLSQFCAIFSKIWLVKEEFIVKMGKRGQKGLTSGY